MVTQGIPEIYADFVQIAISDIGIFLGLHSASPFLAESLGSDADDDASDAPTELKAKVRFSQTGAKAFAIQLRRALKELEENQGIIPLPSGFSQQFDVSADEW